MANKVFISYVHESETLSNSVLDLSNYLRSHDIDSEIDQYEEAPSYSVLDYKVFSLLKNNKLH